MLNYTFDAIITTSDHSAVASGVGNGCGQQRARRIGFTMDTNQFGNGAGTQQRSVTGKNENVGLGGIKLLGTERSKRNSNRITGTALHRLFNKLERRSRGGIDEFLGDTFRSVTNDHDCPIDLAIIERIKDIKHHRPAAQKMQRLRATRTHTSALTRS